MNPNNEKRRRPWQRSRRPDSSGRFDLSLFWVGLLAISLLCSLPGSTATSEAAALSRSEMGAPAAIVTTPTPTATKTSTATMTPTHTSTPTTPASTATPTTAQTAIRTATATATTPATSTSTVTPTTHAVGTSMATPSPTGTPTPTTTRGATATPTGTRTTSTRAATLLTMTAVTATYGATVDLSATLTTAAAPKSPLTDKTVTFSVNGVSMGSATTNVDGIATLSDTQLPAITGGAHPGAIVANYDGDTALEAGKGTADLTITRAPLVVQPYDDFKEAGEENPAFYVAYTGFVLGEDESVLFGSLVITTTATASSPAGSYPVTARGLTSNNYDISYLEGILTVWEVWDDSGGDWDDGGSVGDGSGGSGDWSGYSPTAAPLSPASTAETFAVGTATPASIAAIPDLPQLTLVPEDNAPARPGPGLQGRMVPADRRYFETTGYRVNLDGFWDYFNRRGGLRTFGYPISREFTFQGFAVQLFQRGALQQNRDGRVSTLNLLDPGLMPYNRINGSSFPPAQKNLLDGAPSPTDPNYAARAIDYVRTFVPDSWDGKPVNFLKSYMGTARYEDAFPEGGAPQGLVPLLNLELWGLPTSHPAYDPANRDFIYQRFQRGILHYDAATGTTQGLLLGEYLKAIITGQKLPSDLDSQANGSPLLRQYSHNGPGHLAHPAALTGSNITDAFEPETVY